jgi:hypothetical protein
MPEKDSRSEAALLPARRLTTSPEPAARATLLSTSAAVAVAGRAEARLRERRCRGFSAEKEELASGAASKKATEAEPLALRASLPLLPGDSRGFWKKAEAEAVSEPRGAGEKWGAGAEEAADAAGEKEEEEEEEEEEGSRVWGWDSSSPCSTLSCSWLPAGTAACC